MHPKLNTISSTRVIFRGAPLRDLLPNGRLSITRNYICVMLQPVGLPLIRHYMSSLLQ